MGPKTVAQRIGKSPEEGKRVMDTFFSKFPKVKQLLEKNKKTLTEKGYVEDWAGRRRHLPDFFLPDYEARYKDSEKAEGETFNPFLECKNRQFMDSKLRGWLERAKATRSNEAFDELAKEAAKDGVELVANTGRKAKAERQCTNATIQGGSSSITKMAMICIDKDEELNHCQAKIIIPVHDELLVECPAYYKDRVAERLPQVMVDSIKGYITNVPMSCDPEVVKHWYASVAAVNIRNEYADYEKEMGPEKAFEQVKADHVEFTENCLRKVIYEEKDIEFEEDEE